MEDSPRTNRAILISVALVIAVGALLGPTVTHGFTVLDDNDYIRENEFVRRGLTWPSIAWAFTNVDVSNWHPVTWLSHELDCQLFRSSAPGADVGQWPGGHHLVNVLLHAANAVLLFFFLERTTRASWRSAMVAALFAVHPLRVESVAWVSERKDVLSTLFWLLTMHAYVRYAASRSVRDYVWVAALLAVGLMAKPMLVSLPICLWLLDFWPLHRIATRRDALRLALEKAPLMAMCLAVCAVTMFAQKLSLRGLHDVPLLMRPANAVVAYVRYLGKAFWPVNLAVFYPYPEHLALWWVGLCALILLAITVAVLWSRRGYLIVGWFWYLVTMVPVIGLVQVGRQAMADRYTYVPMMGIACAVVWLVGDAAASRRALRTPLAVGCGVVLLALSIATWRQVELWGDDLRLFQHAIDVTDQNYFMHHEVAVVHFERHEIEAAMQAINESIALKPDYVDAYENRTRIEFMQKRYAAAEADAKKALALEPTRTRMHYLIGAAALGNCDGETAIEHLNLRLRDRQFEPDIHYMLGQAYTEQLRYADAVASYRRSVELLGDANSSLELAWILATVPDPAVRNGEEAVKAAKQAAQLSGGRDPLSLDVLAAAYFAAGDLDDGRATADQCRDALATASNLTVDQQAQITDHLRIYATNRGISQPPTPRRPICQRG